jgi:hypothetical protein
MLGKKTMWPFTRKKQVSSVSLTIEQALAELATVGVALAPGVTLDDLLPSLNGDLTTPVDKIQLLCALGGEAEESGAGLLSHDIWHLDAECIEDHGDYVRLAKRFSVLAGPSLALGDLVDHVDIEAGEASLEFRLDGRKVSWDLAVDNDWMDPALYTNFQGLLRSRNNQRFMICALGQDSLVLCGDEAKRRTISSFSGLQFQWE